MQWPLVLAGLAMGVAALGYRVAGAGLVVVSGWALTHGHWERVIRSEEHTSELQSPTTLFPTRRSSDLAPTAGAALGYRVAGAGLVVVSGWALTHGLWERVIAWCIA